MSSNNNDELIKKIGDLIDSLNSNIVTNNSNNNKVIYNNSNSKNTSKNYDGLFESKNYKGIKEILERNVKDYKAIERLIKHVEERKKVEPNNPSLDRKLQTHLTNLNNIKEKREKIEQSYRETYGRNKSFEEILKQISKKQEEDLKERQKENREKEYKKTREKFGGNVDKTYKNIENFINDPLSLIKSSTGLIDKFLSKFGPIGNAVGSVIGSLGQIAYSLTKLALTNDDAVHHMMATYGFGQKQLSEYSDNQYRNAVRIGYAWGKSLADVMAFQKKFIDATGRAIHLSEIAYNKQFALNKVVGEEKGFAFTTALDEFNVGIQDSVNLYKTMIDTVYSSGLSLTKYTDSVLRTLSIAQSYTFKNGVEGVMKMSIWAEKVGFNLANLEGIINKIQSGGVEGAITNSARLQVLGGNFALNSNPLHMLYNGLEDPEELAKQYSRMLQGIGRMNNKREIEFNGNETLTLRAYAEATGISLKDAKAQVRKTLRREDIGNQLKGIDLSEDSKELIKNLGVWNREKNSYEVTLIDGTKKLLRDLTEEDVKKGLMPETKGESMEEFARRNMSLSDNIKNFTTGLWADIQNLLSSYLVSFLKPIASGVTDFAKDKGGISGLLRSLGSYLKDGFNYLKDTFSQTKIWGVAVLGLLTAIAVKSFMGVGGNIASVLSSVSTAGFGGAKSLLSSSLRNGVAHKIGGFALGSYLGYKAYDSFVDKDEQTATGKVASTLGGAGLGFYGGKLLYSDAVNMTKSLSTAQSGFKGVASSLKTASRFGKVSGVVSGVITAGLGAIETREDANAMREQIQKLYENGEINETMYKEANAKIDKIENIKWGKNAVSGVGAGLGGWGGMALGASIGTAILPGVGTVIGGAIGGIAGAFAGEKVADYGYDAIAEGVGAETDFNSVIEDMKNNTAIEDGNKISLMTNNDGEINVNGTVVLKTEDGRMIDDNLLNNPDFGKKVMSLVNVEQEKLLNGGKNSLFTAQNVLMRG